MATNYGTIKDVAVGGADLVGAQVGDNNAVQIANVLMEVYSDTFLFEALGSERYTQFAEIREELNKMPGDTISFLRYNDISPDGRELIGYAESETIPTGTVSNSKIQMSVKEYAKAIAVSERLLLQSSHDVVETHMKMLGRYYSVWGPDHLLKHVATVGADGRVPSVVYAGDGTVVSRDGLTSDDVLDTLTISRAVEILQTNNVPKFMNEYYVCIIHPHQASHLKRDSEWRAYDQRDPVTGQKIYSHALGMWEDVLFVTTSYNYNGAAASGSPGYLAVASGPNVGDNAYAAGIDPGTTFINLVDVYAAPIFGPGYLAWAWGMTPDFRVSGRDQDLARQLQLGYVMYGGASILQEKHGLVIESA